MPGFIIRNLGGGRESQTTKKEYFTNYNWIIPNLFESTQSNRDNIISLKDATLPSFTVNKKSAITQIEYKFADSITFDDVSVTWYDADGLHVEIMKWKDSVWKPDAFGVRQASEYKKLSVISVYQSFNGGKLINHNLYNSWPSGIKHSDLTYTSSEIKLVTVTITYDWSDTSVEQYFIE
jgi:hypothetical protein